MQGKPGKQNIGQSKVKAKTRQWKGTSKVRQGKCKVGIRKGRQRQDRKKVMEGKGKEITQYRVKGRTGQRKVR